MLRKHLILSILCSLTLSAFTQITLVLEDFNNVSVPNLPTNWTTTHSTQIFTDNAVSSTGYTGASGGANLKAQNCQPNGEDRSFMVANISTLNAVGLDVSFGHRRTGSFTPNVVFEWSSDGATWNLISSITSGNTTWSLINFSLPSGAENQTNLRFRWSYTTDTNNSCTVSPNYRIDDFKLTAQTVMPVDLVYFEVEIYDEDVLLEWQTATEVQNDYFILEHSRNGNDFEELGRVLGAGNSAQILDYDFIHNNPNSGIHYYRLKQVDFDGNYTYGVVQSINIGSDKEIILKNSLAENVLRLECHEPLQEKVQAFIIDYSGQIVEDFSSFLFENQYELSIQTLPSKNYILVIQSRNSLESYRFFKM